MPATKRSARSCFLIVSLLALLSLLGPLTACGDAANGEPALDGDGETNENADTETDTPQQASLFVEGCPKAGEAWAKTIGNPLLAAQGPDAVGRVGDFLLMNSQAAFVIESAEAHNAYYLYGGIVVDAVAITECKQAGPERFEEIGFLMGTLVATDYTASRLRAFRADKVEVINDGRDGKAAVVRATGSDDYFWIVEYELLRSKVNKGERKDMTQPFGLTITVDYILPPNSSVLQIVVTYANETSAEQSLITAAEAMFGDTTTPRYYPFSALAVSSITVDIGLPWIAAQSAAGDGAWAFAMKDANFGTVNISGVTALLDVNQVTTQSLTLAAKGSQGDSASKTYYLSVGPTDGNSATRQLMAQDRKLVPNKPFTTTAISGTVQDKATGAPLGGVVVELQGKTKSDTWRPLDSFVSGADGSFSGAYPNFGSKAPELRLVAKSKGHADSDGATVSAATPPPYTLQVPVAGLLHYEIRDEKDALIPAKILLYQNDIMVERLFALGKADERSLPPGLYTAEISRGYEYDIQSQTIEIKPGKTTTLKSVLTHRLDTAGFLTVDAHCHAGPSPDNTISLAERMASVAGEGLEVVVSTDHEYVGSWKSGIEETELGGFVATVTGQEVTASMPEHTNMYPVVPDYAANARGGFVPWYKKTLGEIFAAERQRGAQIVALNHPRRGNYMSLIRYNRLTGKPDLDDPTLLGYPAAAELWSFDFNTIELMNDPEVIFMDPAKPDYQGTFDDWMSFLNLGHRITGIGVSDAHDYALPGRPRVYFASSTDDPGAFKEEDLVKAMKEGRVVLSTGAFARVSIGEAGLGDTLTATSGTADLKLHIEALPEIDVAYFKVFVNCDQVATIATTGPDAIVKYDGTIPLTFERDAHVVVVGFGRKPVPRAFGTFDPTNVARFVTNAIFLDKDGNGQFDAPGGKACTYDLNPPAAR